MIHFYANEINVALFSIGGTHRSELEGMIPRSICQIFSTCDKLKAKGWLYRVEASFLEISNNKIRDLLGPSGGVHKIQVVDNETIVTDLKVGLNIF